MTIVFQLLIWIHVYLPALWQDLSGFSLYRSCPCFHNHHGLACATSLLCLQSTLLNAIDYLWVLQFFHPFFWKVPRAFQGGFNMFHLKVRIPQSLILRTLVSWGGLWVNFHLCKKILWWGVRDVLNYGYSSKLMIVLLLYLFNRIIVFYFPPGPMTYSLGKNSFFF